MYQRARGNGTKTHTRTGTHFSSELLLCTIVYILDYVQQQQQAVIRRLDIDVFLGGKVPLFDALIFFQDEGSFFESMTLRSGLLTDECTDLLACYVVVSRSFARLDGSSQSPWASFFQNRVITLSATAIMPRVDLHIAIARGNTAHIASGSINYS